MTQYKKNTLKYASLNILFFILPIVIGFILWEFAIKKANFGFNIHTYSIYFILFIKFVAEVDMMQAFSQSSNSYIQKMKEKNFFEFYKITTILPLLLILISATLTINETYESYSSIFLSMAISQSMWASYVLNRILRRYISAGVIQSPSKTKDSEAKPRMRWKT